MERKETPSSLKKRARGILERAKKHLHIHEDESDRKASGITGAAYSDLATYTSFESTPTDYDRSLPPKQSSLWDEAYDVLQEENEQLISKYEELLSRVTTEMSEENSNGPGDMIPQQTATTRRERLEKIAEFSFDKMKDGKLYATFFGKTIAIQEALGQIGNGIGWFQNYAKDALKEVPYAPAAMACTSLLLPLLTSPSTVDEENHKGLLYVTSQMRYYIEMETLLFSFADASLQEQLKEQVKGLYKLVIDYQIESVLKFDRSSRKNYWRSLVDYDGWGDRLEAIRDEEKTLQIRFQETSSGIQTQKLHELQIQAATSRNHLQSISSSAQRIEQIMSDGERRRCLRLLQASDPKLDKQRIEKLKGGLLKDSYRWVIENREFKSWMNSDSDQLLWIKGQPGKGKTMLLCGIIDEISHMASKSTNIAFFFCQATEEALTSSTAVLRGLTFMLVSQQPSMEKYVSERSFDGHNSWFALENTFSDILNDPGLQSTYLMIDGLDECTEGRQDLIDLIVKHSSAHDNVKWIVSSRNWPELERDLDKATRAKIQLELNEAVLEQAIKSFINFKVEYLADRTVEAKDKTEIWENVRNYLLENAKGTFLWVALVCQRLAEVDWWNVEKRLHDFPAGLHNVYDRMISQIMDSENAEICMSILGISTSVLRPITINEITVYINLPDGLHTPEPLIRLCGSFLEIQDGTIFLVHQSAKDFLSKLNSEVIRKVDSLCSLFSRSLVCLRKYLKRDMYDLRVPGFPIEYVKPPAQNDDPLLSIRYACIHWVDHFELCMAEGSEKIIDQQDLVKSFMSGSYLQWLEATSLLNSIPTAIRLMQKLHKLVKEWTNEDSDSLARQVRDAIRFVQYSKVAIESSPLQVYYSSFIFSPTESITKRNYQNLKTINETWILKEPPMDTNWSPRLQTLEGHISGVDSVAFSPNGGRLASHSIESLRIWNSETSDCISVVETDSELYRNTVQWLDENRVTWIWGSSVNIFKVDIGESSQLIKDNTMFLMAWSHDRRRVAFVSEKHDDQIKIFDTNTGSLDSMPKGHGERITSIEWAPKSLHLASGSYDCTVRIWELSSMKCNLVRKNHSKRVNSVAWSPDGNFLASASDDSVGLLDLKTSKFVRLRGHSRSIDVLAWSSDGSKIASGSLDQTIKIWDKSSMNCMLTLKGHIETVQTLAWSPNGDLLASGSADMTIKLWDTTAQFQPIGIGHGESKERGHGESKERGHGESIDSITWNIDKTKLISMSSDIRLWDPKTGSDTVLRKRDFHFGQFYLDNHEGRLAKATFNVVHIWDPTTNQSTVCRGHSDKITEIKWSPDGGKIASGSMDKTIRVWDSITGKQISSCNGHRLAVAAISWAPGGDQLASGSLDYTVRTWDSTTGKEISSCEHGDSYAHAVVWSPDGTRLASSSREEITLSDPATGQCIFTIPIRTPGFLHFDPVDPNYLCTGSGKLDIRHLESDAASEKLRGYGLSEDLSWITYDGIKVLWLPPEHRPGDFKAFSLSDTAVTIGCVSGVVEFYEFSKLNPLKDL